MATFFVNKPAATTTKTLTFKNSSSNSSVRPAVSSPTPTKTLTFKSGSVPTISQSVSFKTTTPAAKTPTPTLAAAGLSDLAYKPGVTKPAVQPAVTKTIEFKTATPPPITVDLAAAMRNLTEKDTVVPTITKVMEFKTQPVVSIPAPISVDLAAAMRNPTYQDKAVPTATKVMEFKTTPAPTSNQSLGAFSSVAAANAITVPQLSSDINKTVQSLVKTANDAANVIASRTDNTWESNASAAEKILITNKIQDALVKAQKAKDPVTTFNNYVVNQLTGLGTVAKASVNVATARVGAAAVQNNADAANALNLISKLASYGMKSAVSAAAAQDMKEVATQSANHVMGITTAANSTLNQDYTAILSSIGRFVKNNINASVEGKQALTTPTKTLTFKTETKLPDLAAAVKKLTSKPVTPTVTKTIEFNKPTASKISIKALNIPPNSKPDVVAKAVYTSIYGDKAPVSAEVFAERYGAILKAVKGQVGSDGTFSAASIASLQNELSGKLVIQSSDLVKEVTIDPGSETLQQQVDRFNAEAAAKGLNKPRDQSTSKAVIPGSGTTDTSKTVIGEQMSPDQKAASTPIKLTPVADAAAKTATEKSAAAQKKASTQTTTAKLVIDPTKMYKTKSGNLIPGKDIQPSDMPFITGLAPAMSGSSMPPSSVPSSASSSSVPSSASSSSVSGRPAETYMGEWKAPAAASAATQTTAMSKISNVAKILSAKNPFGQPISAIQPVTKIITFTPAGMTNVKGSDGQRAVKIDTDIYNSLKHTYKDDQIADLLSDARLGVFVDTKTGDAKIGQVAEKPSETYSESSGIYKVDPYKAVTNPDTGAVIGVPEFTYYKLQKLGIADAEIAKIPKTVLDQMKTADTGSMKPTSGITMLPTTAQEALQLPGERQIGSGLFTEVPLTAAQRQANISATPDPLKDPWGYLVSSAVQKGEDIYTYLAKPEYKNGYKIEPTVAGLLTFNKIATDLAKPGATLDDVKEVGGMSTYETFSATMAHASPEILSKIAKNNPRLIVGASVDNSLQGILEAKMGDDYWKAIATGLTNKEYQDFETEVKKSPIDKSMGDIIKGYVETGADLGKMPDIVPYATGQLYQLGKDIIISPVTPNVGVNLLLAPLLIIGKAPVTIAKTGTKAGEKAGVLTLVKTAQGLSALRDGKVIGSVVGDAKDASKFVVDGFDGSKIELSVVGDKVTATEVKEPSVVIGPKAATETVPFSKGDRPAETYMGEWKAPAKTTVDAQTTPTRIIEFKKTTPDSISAGPLATVDVKIPTKAKATDLKVANEMDQFLVTPEKLAAMSSVEPEIAYKALTSSDLDLVEDLGDGVYRASNGQKYVKYSKDKYLPVGDGYNPKEKGILSVESISDTGEPNVVHLITADSVKDTFHITYEDANGLKKTITTVPGKSSLTDAEAMEVAQKYENGLADGSIAAPETPKGASPENVKAMQDEMEQKLADINAQLDSEKEPSGGGGGGGDYGGSSGGNGGSTYTPPETTADISQWTENTDWGARVRSLDNGKTWQVEDPETLAAMSTTDYEKVVAERIETRRSKYDAATNTYKKIDKGTDGKWTVEKYQDSTGGWVTKDELDAERAAIAANNPTYTMGADGTARIRTNDSTHVVQYLDEMTGNWVTKDVYDALKGSSETPIWNAEGGYYYYKKADGSFEIQNPWTNTRQTPDEYGKYLSDKAAASTPVAPTQVATYQTPSSYDSYVPNLQSNYATTVAPIEARATTAEEAIDAWTAFTRTPDFDRIIKSEADTKILVKAKDGKSLSAEEIDRALYLRSRMSPEGQAAFDLATGGQTSANLMPMTDFENMITGNRASIGTMSDAEIKASGLPPEKEIIVHQTKAEENLGRFLMSDEYQGASTETRKIINAELGYYAGEPSTVPNLLNKFNEIKKDWTIPTSESWDKTVEAMRSSKNLITDMPPWWKAENVDFSVSEMVLGKNKYADVVLGEKATGPTKYVMETAFQKARNDGFVIAGEDGYQATKYTHKKLDGWIVRSPDGGDISFIAKNEFVNSAEDAISAYRAPLDMYFWEKPRNVPNEFQVPVSADGSIVEAVTKVDPFSFPEATWKGLTDAGGLSKDMTKEFVKIDLRTPDGQLWSTIREADKSKAFTVGKKVDIFEQDAIRINGLSGTEIQAMNAADYREFIAANADEIRNLPAEDLPYLNKYLDETRSNLIDEIRATEGQPVASRAAEAVTVQEKAPSYSKVQTDELQAAWKDEMKGMNDDTFKDMVARNMDDIEQLDIEKLGLSESRKAIIRGEIKDRNFMRSLESRVNEINNRVARSRADMQAGKKTKYAHVEEVKQGIEDKNALLRNVEDIKANFAERFGEAEKVTCEAGTGFTAGLGAEGRALTPLLTIATAGGAGLAVGLAAMEGLNYKNNLVANFEAQQRALHGAAVDGQLPVAATNSTASTAQTNTTAPAAFTSMDQIDRSAEYVTKSGNLYKGVDLVETDLPYIVRKAGGQ